MKKQLILLLNIFIFYPYLYTYAENVAINEMVMPPGMVIQVKNVTGTISIFASDDLERIYYWDGRIKKVKMIPRDERWYGNYGVYNPGGDRDVHVVMVEGQQHFYSQQEAYEWLMHSDISMNRIYTNDGLVVGWYKDNISNSQRPGILRVDVIQLYILCKKPVDLPNAQDSLFTISYKNGITQCDVVVGQFQSSSPAVLNGRLYSGKAIDIMKEHGITAKGIEKCIKKGSASHEGEYVYYLYNYIWVKIDNKKRVVLVGK